MGKFVIKKSSNNQYYFLLKASGNHEIILTSEMYTTKALCQNGIESAKVNARDDSRYDRLRSKDDKYYFNLNAANGEIIGTSEMYYAQDGMQNGIASVKANAPNATTEDST